MKLGIAFRGMPGAGAAVPEILTQCRRRGLRPEGFLLSGDTFRGFLADCRGMSYTGRRRFFRLLKHQGIRRLEDIAPPFLCCEYDLLEERSTYLGNTLRFPRKLAPVSSLKQLDRRMAKRGVYHSSGSFWYHGYLSSSQLFLGLTLLGCECGILFELLPKGEKEQVIRVNPKQVICRIPLNLSLSLPAQIFRWFERHQLELLSQ